MERLLIFLKNTNNDKRHIGLFNLESIYTWIDAEYDVHPDMKSHTGGAVSFGQGMLHCLSENQKLNIKSSTEAEVVGISDYLPYNIHLVMFMKHQGYTVLNNVVFQENQGSIKMKPHGQNLCTGNPGYFEVRYLFTKKDDF